MFVHQHGSHGGVLKLHPFTELGLLFIAADAPKQASMSELTCSEIGRAMGQMSYGKGPFSRCAVGTGAAKP